ncbi:fumarylacetoacetate hydrolase domain-containing protein 2 [Drosophila obscura]|uniref:fumarylacetoacetate hydrolase domain-containing protein 2 n=1 Tax=Drosophila obscura TaxID=7282 RepID=UPI001BB1DB31|nr:fumarylacetoacetate hydrolase domain-containing protein 2 [Drosophila obscura]
MKSVLFGFRSNLLRWRAIGDQQNQQQHRRTLAAILHQPQPQPQQQQQPRRTLWKNAALLVSPQEKTQPQSGEMPRLRFMQYQRPHDAVKRLGVVSDDGSKMVELSINTCADDDMVKFIRQRYCMNTLLDNLQYLKVRDVYKDLRLLPPIGDPCKIVGVQNNYADNCDEQHIPIPREPSFFVKFSTSITGPLDNIQAHRQAKHIDYGCQLVVVIERTCRKVPRSAAMKHIFGYTLAQDITARDWSALLGGKSLDTFCPLGPAIVHKSHVPDVNNLWIKTIVNGEQRQTGNTRNMIFKIDYLVHRLSQFITLYPGDMILTGTPAGAGAYRRPTSFLQPGDRIDSEIQILGKMSNRVVNAVA